MGAHVGAEMRKRRQDLGLSQQEMADLVDISRSYYTNIELGMRRPGVDTAKRIAGILGFDWTRFYEDEKKQISTA
ncbi:putative HTH-type transcriptional regulator YqaF [Alicyclobacillus contaminans]|uniref:helix-turn-helix transcriptional regulator n=1 Tax=Alicyclobacillus contaminans TaxID=392016 RepID=UPI00040E902B|nr:helix-turn-helix transcriptional regulator [Alicyclobacillus contaminans]GMA49372.1 putative HTH-type transcriptional regulator YqaF [Alicyclobacillus contaminans]